MVGHAPTKLDDAHAAALPLTSITAWELLFERLRVIEGEGEGDTLLIIGAAGGVGSMLVQLARRLTRLTVIGTASRPETQRWVTDLGAHQVVDHTRPLASQLQQIGLSQVRYVTSLTHTDTYYAQLADIIAPQGALGVIDDPKTLDAVALKSKSISLHWEFMFTRSMYQTPDLIAQHELLERITKLIDNGTLRTTIGDHLGAINAANLRRAHALIETNRTRGKTVLERF
jgi:zinc-binding alcohol dehydrogenase family protein